MKKYIRLFYCILCIIFALSVGGCDKKIVEEKIITSIEDKYLNSDSYKVDLDFKSIFYYIRLVEDNIVFVNNKNKSIEYIQRYANGDQISCGINDHFIMSMKQSALNYPYLYFYIGEIDEESGAQVNTLTRINLKTNTIERIDHKDNSILGLGTYIFNGEIVTIKNEVLNNKTITYIDSYNIDGNTWSKHMECLYDNTSAQGEKLYGICSNQKNLFILHDVCDSKDGISHYIEMLDTDYNIIKGIEIGDHIHNYEMTSFISDMQAFGDYIYFYNASNYGYLAEIKNECLNELYSDRNFEIAVNSSDNHPVFFIRRSSKIFFFNEQDGTLEKCELKIKKDYSIKTVLCDKDFIFVVFYADDKPDFSYLVPKSEISNMYFSCE